MAKKVIFVSYSDLDNNKMRCVERVIIKAGKFSPRIIADNRQALVQLSEKVSKGIIECDYFVPIITRRSISTQWLNQEIGYAVAIKKRIIPIVEGELIDKLKGFIHKQLDLSYSFEASEKKEIESTRFLQQAKKMINDLLIENAIAPKNMVLGNLFPGKWTSRYTLNGRTGSDRDIEIRDGNKYYVGNKHWFNIEDLKVDVDSKKVSFKKVGIGADRRVASNELVIIELAEVYQGIEEPDTPIVYTRMQS
jgi:hypothetical protein